MRGLNEAYGGRLNAKNGQKKGKGAAKGKILPKKFGGYMIIR